MYIFSRYGLMNFRLLFPACHYRLPSSAEHDRNCQRSLLRPILTAVLWRREHTLVPVDVPPLPGADASVQALLTPPPSRRLSKAALSPGALRPRYWEPRRPQCRADGTNDAVQPVFN